MARGSSTSDPGRHTQVVTVEGKFNRSAVDDFHAAMAEARARGGHLLVDLTTVTSLDTVGVEAIAREALAAASTNDSLLVLAQPHIVRQARQLGLGDLLRIQATQGRRLSAARQHSRQGRALARQCSLRLRRRLPGFGEGRL